jgi:hypothetical protein
MNVHLRTRTNAVKRVVAKVVLNQQLVRTSAIPIEFVRTRQATIPAETCVLLESTVPPGAIARTVLAGIIRMEGQGPARPALPENTSPTTDVTTAPLAAGQVPHRQDAKLVKLERCQMPTRMVATVVWQVLTPLTR